LGHCYCREDDGPVAGSSRLGWLLSGHTKHSRDCDVVNLALVDTAIPEVDELTVQLQQFWDTEAIGIMEDTQTEDKLL